MVHSNSEPTGHLLQIRILLTFTLGFVLILKDQFLVFFFATTEIVSVNRIMMVGGFMNSKLLLDIYELGVKRKEPVNAVEFQEEFEISPRTLQRYIAHVNAYMFDTFTCEELVYDRSLKSYIVKKV